MAMSYRRICIIHSTQGNTPPAMNSEPGFPIGRGASKIFHRRVHRSAFALSPSTRKPPWSFFGGCVILSPCCVAVRCQSNKSSNNKVVLCVPSSFLPDRIYNTYVPPALLGDTLVLLLVLVHKSVVYIPRVLLLVVYCRR